MIFFILIFFFIFFHPTFSDQNPEFNIYTPFYIGLICIGPHFASSETLPSLSLSLLYLFHSLVVFCIKLEYYDKWRFSDLTDVFFFICIHMLLYYKFALPDSCVRSLQP